MTFKLTKDEAIRANLKTSYKLASGFRNMESIILKTTTLSDITAFFMIYLQTTSALRTLLPLSL